MTRRLGRYHLVEPIGGGPTGEVHRARVYGVAGFERQFAVKKFHPEVVSNPNVAAKLSAAARAYGGLEHPRIARLFEYGVAGGDTFTACELVPGLDLAQLLAASNQPLPPGAAFALIASAARAVGYAHGRGILHLGLSPTNLIATPDGDLKVTDVGILAPRLPSRPSDDPQLMWRLAYLAPEQLVGEASSAATDVFAFGVIAFELVTGQRAFLGATALDVEQAILSGQPREPALPKPLLRVLQRCWARSPFERFPDARALADAVDAALRLAPVPGGKREVAALVREALERIELVREQQLSGALNLPMMPSTPPLSAPPQTPAPVIKRAPSAPPVERVVVPEGPVTPARPSQPIARITPVPMPSSTTPPPRMVVPPVGSTPTPVPAPPRPMPRGSQPSRPPAAVTVAGTPPPAAVGDTTGEVTITRSPLDQALSTLGAADADPVTPPPVALAAVVNRAPGDRGPVPAGTPRMPTDGDSVPTAVRDPSEILQRTVVDDDKATSKMPPIELSRALTFSEALEPEISVEPGEPSRADSSGVLLIPAGDRPSSRSSDPSIEMQLDSGDMDAVDASSPDLPLAPAPPPLPVPAPPLTPPPTLISAEAARELMPPRKTPSALGQVQPVPDEPRPPAPRNRTLWAVLGAMMAVGALAAGVMAWQQWGERTTIATPAAPPNKDRSIARPTVGIHPTPSSTGSGSGTGSGQGPGHGTGSSAAVPASGSAAAPVPVPASGSAAVPAPSPGAGSAAIVKSPDRSVPDTVSIVSTPPGATVFLDGAEQGKTPLTLPTARDKHTIAVVKDGFDLYLKEMAGGGEVQATLVEVTPTGGPAGIKVKCKTKDRYYVIVDGAGTGMLCPTERVHVTLGPHTVEVYDLVTEQRTQYPVVVKDTEHSLRVKLD